MRWGSAASFLANLALRSRTSRWFLDKFFGVSTQRRLPRFAPRSFMAQAKRRGWTRKPNGAKPVVLYFVDLYANFIEPQIAEATVAVLAHNGFDVFIPLEQRSSGLDALVHGDVETAREVAQKNLRVLVEAARAGWPIVCPSRARLMLMQTSRTCRPTTTGPWRTRRWSGSRSVAIAPARQARTDFAAGHSIDTCPCHVMRLMDRLLPDLLRLIPQLRMNKTTSAVRAWRERTA